MGGRRTEPPHQQKGSCDRYKQTGQSWQGVGRVHSLLPSAISLRIIEASLPFVGMLAALRVGTRFSLYRVSVGIVSNLIEGRVHHGEFS